MRPRINSFGQITRKELDNYLVDNSVYGLTVNAKYSEYTNLYTYIIMFRDTRHKPEELYIEVSKQTKLVFSAWTNKGRKFNNIDELKKYTKR